MRILVTGFEAFGGETTNPSEEIINRLSVEYEKDVAFLKLPVEFVKAGQVLEEQIKIIRPDMVISLGQAGGRKGISIERVAINIDDAIIPDNIGDKPEDIPISIDGSTAYFSTLPIKGLVDCLGEKKIDAHVSNSAGTYVCNHVMYTALHLAATKYPYMKAGFIHVPYMTEQIVDKKDKPAMELTIMIEAIESILDYLLQIKI